MKYLNDPVRRRSSRLFVALLGLLSAFAPISIDMYLPAMPSLARDLGSDAAHVQLTLSAFLIGFGLIPLVVGPILDRFGRRAVLIVATSCYIGVSLACWLVATIDQFIVLRLLQGLAAGCAPVAVRAMVRDTYERDDAARVMSLTMLIVSAVPMLAPILGGWMLVGFGWRAIFLTLGLFGALALAALLLFVPETLDPRLRRTLHWRSIAAGYGQLLRDGPFLRYILTGGLLFAAMFAYISGAPFVLIDLYGVAPEHFGFLFMANIASMMIGATVNGRLVRRLGSERLLAFGTVMAAGGGLSLLAMAATGSLGLVGLIAPVLLVTGAMGLVAPNATALALQNWPHLAGTAGALSGFVQFGLGAVSGAIVGLLHGNSALPMAGVMAACATLCLLMHRFGPRAQARRGAPLPRSGPHP